MESSGVSQLYKRSIEKRKLRYIPFIGDGDSSSYSRICIEKPYGEVVFIPKVDCIAHVTKRMGTNLRSLVRDYKGNYCTLIKTQIILCVCMSSFETYRYIHGGLNETKRQIETKK